MSIVDRYKTEEVVCQTFKKMLEHIPEVFMDEVEEITHEFLEDWKKDNYENGVNDLYHAGRDAEGYRDFLDELAYEIEKIAEER